MVGGGGVFTSVFQVLDLSLHKLKYSCNVKDMECLKCIICIERFILQHVSRPERKSHLPHSQSESDLKIDYIEDYHFSVPPREYHNRHRRHSSANARL